MMDATVCLKQAPGYAETLSGDDVVNFSGSKSGFCVSACGGEGRIFLWGCALMLLLTFVSAV